MDIDGLGEKITKQMVARGMVEDIADLYRLSKDDLLQLEGFAAKSAKNLYHAIQGSKKARLDRFLYALGIRHVGHHVAQVLSRKYQSLESLRKKKKSSLEETPEIGPEIAQSVVEFFQQDVNKKVLKKLAKSGVEVKPMPEEGQDLLLEGQTFVFTGELKKYTRDEAKKQVENLGARASSRISGETDYVVVGENPGSKLAEAKKHHTKLLDEKEFEKLIKRK
jgi:DNA ligase (NAD+)